MAPVFDEGDDTTREVAENTPAGQDIGGSVEATDADVLDTLTYVLSCPDSSLFGFDPTSGQIRTKDPLNFEAEKDSYAVTVTATDPHDKSDYINVTINVTAVNEPPEVENRIQDQNITSGTGSRSLSPSERLSDPENNSFTYSASSSNTSVVTTQISGTSLALTPVGPGSATVTVIAIERDPEGEDTPLRAYPNNPFSVRVLPVFRIGSKRVYGI